MARSLEKMIMDNYNDDPILYYKSNYKGVTRLALKRQKASLYELLRRRGLMEGVPIVNTPLIETINTDYKGNPILYYKSNYKGVTRGPLKKLNPGFYKILKELGLLSQIPTQKACYGDDSLKCYNEFFEGLPRNELQTKAPGLYQRMLSEGLIDHVPLAEKSEVERAKSPFGYDAFAYYTKYYHGLTRGQVKDKNPSLYNRLRKDNLLKKIPLLRKTKKKNSFLSRR
ncbi:MAG: hypothetical protein Q8R00_00460 [Candidatus Nanoarchaeia archaeon]|nr:hypothetical protein [Candidatus Nanoarchaeia archaeon]